jgi:hypothetical protein
MRTHATYFGTLTLSPFPRFPSKAVKADGLFQKCIHLFQIPSSSAKNLTQTPPLPQQQHRVKGTS